ncbi:hypothetical protein [Exiguobacterium acetylicum]|uniref:Uncharacterized protein n=1 Tax=Salmonella enteritidis PT4 (strain P125109) TaxID=550537 RepID=A0A724WTU9_SALEP|nr:hypothetical protein [Exiguobacterium acetylicum]QZY88568.1 hypothetical protein K7G97_16675 [Exiguobacterium acetylicum]HAE0520941.1 hypothetical protein [Salmonella enterica subsp. enterica serovar Enteritidis str. P125109]
MLFVRFTDVPKDGFPNYERLPYEEALLLSTQVHQEAQQANERFASEFRIFDDADQLVYKGMFQFGDLIYPNLYLQLKDRIPRIRIRKEDATKKILLLENLERLTPESYKTMTTSVIQQQSNATHVSRLRRGQRRLVYGVSGVSLLLLGALSVVQLVQPDPPSGVQAETSDWQPLYEAALTGETGPLVERLEKRKSLNDEQQQFLITQYVEEQDYDQAVSVTKDPIDVETIIMQSKRFATNRQDTLQAFQAVYPTDEGTFDLSILQKDYKRAVSLTGVEMTTARQEAKTRAYIALKDVTKAQESVKLVHDEELKEQVATLVQLDEEIQALEDQKRQLSEKTDKKELEKLNASLEAKQRQVSSLF